MDQEAPSVNGTHHDRGAVPGPPDPSVRPDSDATIDFVREEGKAEPSAMSEAAPDYTFLESARGGDELGWLEHYRVRRLIGDGGHGSRLPRRGHAAAPAGRAQGDPPRAVVVGRRRGPIHSRGEGGGGDQARSRRHHLSGRRGGRGRLPGDGVSPGDLAPALARSGQEAVDRPDLADRPRGRLGARPRAQAGPGASGTSSRATSGWRPPTAG